MFDNGFQPPNCNSGHDFELWVQRLLVHRGFDAKLTGGNDNGVDIMATTTVNGKEYKFYIQCKYYNRTVGKTPIQEIYTGCQYFGGDGYPVVITNNKMTSEAKYYAKKLGVELITEPQWNQLRLIAKLQSSYDESLTGLFGIILSRWFYRDRTTDMAVRVYDKVPILELEHPTDKEHLKQELISAFDQAEILLQEAAEKQADVFRVQQQAMALQKSALLKNLEYG